MFNVYFIIDKVVVSKSKLVFKKWFPAIIYRPIAKINTFLLLIGRI